MASITKQPGGRRAIQFTAADGKRKTLRLGKISRKAAEGVRTRVEDLVSASITRYSVSEETSHWLAGLDAKMSDKLAAVGLIPKRDVATLAAFVDKYIEGRNDVKPGTVTVLGHTRRCLVEFFGADKPLRDITPGEADDWYQWLLADQGLAENTARRRCGIAKQFCNAAVRRKLLTINPFADLSAGCRSNPSRYYFVTREETEAVIEACPDVEWRLIVTLSRYGGLRCPSEHLALRWSDVDWGRSRIRIPSPKTEHHEGGDCRMIPLFPELLPHLREAFEEAEDGAEWVITRTRDTTVNLRKRLGLIIKKAGLTQWPKLFQNMRSSRETELAESWPLHVVCAWIGNTTRVAAKHYLQVTDDHFKRAAEALQNPTQQPHVSPRVASQAGDDEGDEAAVFEPLQPIAAQCDSKAPDPMGEAGFEPAPGINPEGVLSPQRLPFRHSPST